MEHFLPEFLERIEHIGQVGERVTNALLFPLSALVQHRMLLCGDSVTVSAANASAPHQRFCFT